MPEAGLRVVVLGAYGVIGRHITRGLLERADCFVTAAGRDRGRLSDLGRELSSSRLTLAVIDVRDTAALDRGCRDADIVVNCVGPYIVSGYDIAKRIVESGRHYLDFAFEQFHYRRIEALDAVARENGTALITGAGEVVGLSSVLCADAVARLPRTETLVVTALEGRSHDRESGFSSLLNGALEPALGNQDYVDGRYVPARMGADTLVRTFPEPHGTMTLLSDPTIDSLILPRRYPLRTVKNYFGMGVSPPAGFFAVMRALDPYRRRAFYGLAETAVRRIKRRSWDRKQRDGVPVAQCLRIEAESREERVLIELRFQPQINCTAYLPILICGMIAGRELAPVGLQTGLDLVTPQRLFGEMETYRSKGLVDWTISGPIRR